MTTLLQRLHDSEIEAKITIRWAIRSPFGTQGLTASGEASTMAEAEAAMTSHAARLFPDSNFAQALEADRIRHPRPGQELEWAKNAAEQAQGTP